MILKCRGFNNHKCKEEIDTSLQGVARKRCPECSAQHHLELARYFNRNHPRKLRAKHYNKRELDGVGIQPVRPAKTILTIRQLQNVPVEQWDKLEFLKQR